MRFQSLPLRLRAYIVLVLALGLGALVAGFTIVAPQPMNLGLVAALVVSSALLSRMKIPLTVRGGAMTFNSAVVCAAVILPGAGMPAALLCAAAGALVGSFNRIVPGRLWPVVEGWIGYRAAFNVAMSILAAALGGIGFHLAINWLHSGEAARVELTVIVAGAMIFQAIDFTLTSVGLAIALGLLSSKSSYRLWRDNFLWTWSSYLMSALIAVVVGAAYRTPWIGAWALLLLSLLYFVYGSYRMYLEKMNLYVAKVEADMRYFKELNELNAATLACLAAALEARDRSCGARIKSVQRYAVALAEAMGLTGLELEAVKSGALVHDIGTLGVPEQILTKTGELTPEETRQLQEHVTIGAGILEKMRFPYPLLPVVLTHHERWDGLGYPRGLRGEEIPIGGRILAIADAATPDNPEQAAVSPEETLAAIQAGAGRQFDPKLVDRFAGIFADVRRGWKLEA